MIRKGRLIHALQMRHAPSLPMLNRQLHSSFSTLKYQFDYLSYFPNNNSVIYYCLFIDLQNNHHLATHLAIQMNYYFYTIKNEHNISELIM
jgi:hypothetical protein